MGSGLLQRYCRFAALVAAALPQAEHARAQQANTPELGARARVAPTVAEPHDDATASGTAIDARDRGLALEQLSEAVSQVPGVHVRSSGGFGAFSGLALRGADLAHTAVVLDTIPLTTPDSGAFDLGQLPLSVLERVEVYRGGAPLWLSEGAIGGLLRLVPARAERPRLRASAGYGSFGRYELGATSALAAPDAALAPALLSHVSLAGADNDYPYFDDLGTQFVPGDGRTLRQQNARIDSGDGLLHAGIDALGGRASLLLLGHGRSEGIPGPLALPSSGAHRNLVRLLSAVGYERERFGADGERDSRLSLLASGSLQRTRFSDFRELGMAEAVAADDLALRGFVRAGGSLRVLPWLEPTLLGSFARDEYLPEDRLAFSAPPRAARRSSETLALEARVYGRIADLPAELRPSVRAEWSQAEIGMAAAAASRHVFAPTYRLAAGIELSPALALSTSAATGKRLPSFLELFGDRALLDPNPALQPERSRTLDASVVGRGRAGALRGGAELRGFVLWIDDMIRYERSSELTLRPANLASARILGLELGLHAQLDRHLSLVSALTALDSQNQLGRSLAFRPPLELLVRPELSWAPAQLDRAVLFVELRHVAFVYLDDRSNDTSLPGRTLFALGATIELLHRRLRLQGRISNLFDAPATDVLSRPLPGREVLAVLTLEQEGL